MTIRGAPPRCSSDFALGIVGPGDGCRWWESREPGSGTARAGYRRASTSRGANEFAAGDTRSPPAWTRRPGGMRRPGHLRVRNQGRARTKRIVIPREPGRATGESAVRTARTRMRRPVGCSPRRRTSCPFGGEFIRSWRAAGAAFTKTARRFPKGWRGILRVTAWDSADDGAMKKRVVRVPRTGTEAVPVKDYGAPHARRLVMKSPDVAQC